MIEIGPNLAGSICVVAVVVMICFIAYMFLKDD